MFYFSQVIEGRLRLKCDATRAETRFRLSAKRTSPFKSAGVSVQSTTGSRGVCICGNNAGYTKFRGSMKGTGYPLHLPVSSSLLRPCVTVCHRVSTGFYLSATLHKFICKKPSVLISKCWRRKCQLDVVEGQSCRSKFSLPLVVSNVKILSLSPYII